jgi:hypothetical protein
MRKRWFVFIPVRFVLALLLAGCDKNNSTEPGTTGTNDKDAMSSIVADDALFQTDALLLNDGDPTAAVTSSNSLGKVGTTIIPRNWGRKVETFSRNVTFTVLTDSTAIATVTHTLQGFVWINAKYASKDTAFSTIKKNFTETIVRLVKFVRINRTKDPRNNWKISEISAIKGGTTGAQITMNEVRFYIGSDTVVVTDPNNTFMKLEKGVGRFIPELTADINVPIRAQVTVTSSAPDSDFVYVHRPYFNAGQWQYRAHMNLVSSTPNGDGTFTRLYEISWKGAWQGRHNMLVSAVTRGSILDDTTPFSSQIWGVPFIVQ